LRTGLIKDGKLYLQAGAGIYYLDKQYYSKEFGWSHEPVSGMETPIV